MRTRSCLCFEAWRVRPCSLQVVAWPPLPMAQMLKIKAAGGIDFPIEVAATGATVQDVKIAATAGCDMDPEVMKAGDLLRPCIGNSLRHSLRWVQMQQLSRGMVLIGASPAMPCPSECLIMHE